MARARRNTDIAAFTVVELVIAVLVLGILAAAAAPKYTQAMAFYRIQAAAQRVAADLRLAGDEARRTSQPQTITFNVAADSYAIPTIANLDRRTETYAVNFPALPYRSDITSADFGGADSVTFDIHGRPNVGGAVVVQWQNRERTILLDIAGNVTVQ